MPFARLPPADEPLPRRRALARVARGIKLHPRSDRFRRADERGARNALASSAGCRYVHAGRWIPRGARRALDLTAAHRVCEIRPRLRRDCRIGTRADTPHLSLTTALWSASTPDSVRPVPPGQILFASDMLTGRRAAATMAFRAPQPAYTASARGDRRRPARALLAGDRTRSTWAGAGPSRDDSPQPPRLPWCRRSGPSSRNAALTTRPAGLRGRWGRTRAHRVDLVCAARRISDASRVVTIESPPGAPRRRTRASRCYLPLTCADALRLRPDLGD